MRYRAIEERLDHGGVVILDGGTGSELERRGIQMSQEAWCGAASLQHAATLEAVHLDYIKAGADIITANTFASSRLMLGPAVRSDQVDIMNRAAVLAAMRARDASGRQDVLVAGSISHMIPVIAGTHEADQSKAPDCAMMYESCLELAMLHLEEGCDLILLEMMYHPDRMVPAFQAAKATGLPVWAGFSTRRGDDGRVLSFAADRDLAFEELIQVLRDFDIAAAGVMHSPATIVHDSIAILRDAFNGPLIAYPDSGHFKMPNWQFDAVMPPDNFYRFATEWVQTGVQVIGGCCGLSPAHIAAVSPLKAANRAIDGGRAMAS